MLGGIFFRKNCSQAAASRTLNICIIALVIVLAVFFLPQSASAQTTTQPRNSTALQVIQFPIKAGEAATAEISNLVSSTLKAGIDGYLSIGEAIWPDVPAPASVSIPSSSRTATSDQTGGRPADNQNNQNSQRAVAGTTTSDGNKASNATRLAQNLESSSGNDQQTSRPVSEQTDNVSSVTDSLLVSVLDNLTSVVSNLTRQLDNQDRVARTNTTQLAASGNSGIVTQDQLTDTRNQLREIMSKNDESTLDAASDDDGPNIDSTDDVSEGSNNLYYTNKRVDSRTNELLDGGTNITLNYNQASSSLRINAATSSGQANTASNLGTGAGIFAQKSDIDLQFKSLTTGSNVTLATSSDEIMIGSTQASPAGSDGAIQFNNSSAFSADGANLFWDAANNRLGVGTSSPVSRLSVFGTTTVKADGQAAFQVQNTSGENLIEADTSNEELVVRDPNTTGELQLWNNSGTSNIRTNGLGINLQAFKPGPGESAQIQLQERDGSSAISFREDFLNFRQGSASIKGVDSLEDSDSNKLLGLTSVSSAANNLDIANATSGGTPELSAVGNNSDVDISVSPKGAGGVGIATTSPNTKLTVAGAATVTGTTTTNRLDIGSKASIYSEDDVLNIIESGNPTRYNFGARPIFQAAGQNVFSIRGSGIIPQNNSAALGQGYAPWKELYLTQSIKDGNSNELLGMNSNDSAVNYLSIANSASGGSPTLTATGTDNSVDLKLKPKATDANGKVVVESEADSEPLFEVNNPNFSGSNGTLGVRIYDGGGSSILQEGTSLNIETLDSYPLSFSTNGSSRMQIDSSGNVGIGTTSPSSKLTVEDDSDSPRLSVGSSTKTNLFVGSNGNVGVGTSSIDAKLTVDTNKETKSQLARIISNRTDYYQKPKYDGLVLDMDSEGRNTPIRVRQNSSADNYTDADTTFVVQQMNNEIGVGINKDNPDANIDIEGKGTWLKQTRGNDDLRFSIADENRNTQRITVKRRELAFDVDDCQYCDPAERLRIDGSGNVGIGTSSPNAALDVERDNGNPRLSVGSSTATDLLVGSDGNVGVGVINPDKMVQIGDGDTVSPKMFFYGSTTSGTNEIQFANKSNYDTFSGSIFSDGGGVKIGGRSGGTSLNTTLFVGRSGKTLEMREEDNPSRLRIMGGGDTNAATLRLGSPSNDDTKNSRILFSNNNSGGGSEGKAGIFYTPSSSGFNRGNLDININNKTNTDDLTEPNGRGIRLTRFAEVGINNKSPAAGLDVQTPTSTKDVFIARDDTGSELARLTNEGNLGIGTNSPNSNLNVETTLATSTTEWSTFTGSEGGTEFSISGREFNQFGSPTSVIELRAQAEDTRAEDVMRFVAEDANGGSPSGNSQPFAFFAGSDKKFAIADGGDTFTALNNNISNATKITANNNSRVGRVSLVNDDNNHQNGAGIDAYAENVIDFSDKNSLPVSTKIVNRLAVGHNPAHPNGTFGLQNATDTIPVLTASDDQGNELMRLTNSGKVGIGTTTPKTALSASGTISQTKATGCTLEASASGDIICSTSDENLKTDKQTIDNALDRLTRLDGYTYEFRNQDRFGDGEQIGFMAQDVERVFPQLVRDTGEYKTLDYGNMTAVLAEAIKEINSKVETAASSSINAVGGFVKNGVARFKKLIADNVVAEKDVRAGDRICIDGECLDKSDVRTLINIAESHNNATTSEDVSGTSPILDSRSEDQEQDDNSQDKADDNQTTSTTTDSTEGDTNPSTQESGTSTSATTSPDTVSTTTQQTNTTDEDTKQATSSLQTDLANDTSNEQTDETQTNTTSSSTTSSKKTEDGEDTVNTTSEPAEVSGNNSKQDNTENETGTTTTTNQ